MTNMLNSVTFSTKRNHVIPVFERVSKVMMIVMRGTLASKTPKISRRRYNAFVDALSNKHPAFTRSRFFSLYFPVSFSLDFLTPNGMFGCPFSCSRFTCSSEGRVGHVASDVIGFVFLLYAKFTRLVFARSLRWRELINDFCNAAGSALDHSPILSHFQWRAT